MAKMFHYLKFPKGEATAHHPEPCGETLGLIKRQKE